MSTKLSHNSYGKSEVRVTRVIRSPNGLHRLIEMSVDVQLGGDFAETYFTGDNSTIVATDSMKNTVYVLAKQHALPSIESFAIDLAKHFVQTYSHIESAQINIRESRWGRIKVRGQPHHHAFVSCGNELRTCGARISRGDVKISGGLTNLLVLKTTDSAFAGFVRDQYTTLRDTEDRIFATSVTATWDYLNAGADFNAAYEAIRDTLLETFAQHMSLSVQQTLYAMGQAALARCDTIARIDLRMPNQHRILVNLEPFGLENHNEVFVWTDEPFGDIHGTIERT